MEGKTMNNTNKKILLVFGGVILILVILMVCIISIKPDLDEHSEFSSIKQMCELTTLKCYYHNVGEYETGVKNFLGIGYKKYWIEYTGIIEYGIDVEQMEINDPNEAGVIKVYMPSAKVLHSNVDEKSMGTPITDTGIFTTISIEEKSKAYSSAQATMKENAEKDTTTIKKATDNAKRIIEEFIKSVSEKTGKEYTIEWLKQPLNK